MRIGIGVSVRVRDVTVDPGPLLDHVAALLARHGITAERSGDVVLFTAADAATLTVLDRPLTGWWQSHGPSTRGDVTLRFVGPGGVDEVSWCAPDRAVETVRRQLEFGSGPLGEPGPAEIDG